MLELLDEFRDIIKSTSIEKYDVSGGNIKLRMKLILMDGSQLFIRETIISGEKRKYSYHWQDKNNTTIKRWDNAPDWDLETYPHHLHVGETVVPSYDRSIEKVLRVIRKEIQEKD
jgi:hypothetical protein